MTRFLFTSDWHVDASTAGIARFDEFEAYVDAMLDTIERDAVDVVCFLGDAFDPGSMFEGMYSAAVVRAWHKLTTAALLGSVFIPGNHDVLDTSRPRSTLSPLAEISSALGRTLAAYRGGRRDCAANVCEVPEFVAFRGAGVLALPYVSRAVDRSGRYDDAFGVALDAAKASRDPVVVIGHYSIPGIVPGSEEDMLRGRELPFPLAAIESLRPALVVNGHYHARQTARLGSVDVEIVGAPAQFTFGERDVARGFLIAEV